MLSVDLNTGMEIVDRDECFKLLATEEVGRLGVVIAGGPEIFPVNYAVDDDGVIFRTNHGTKLTGSVEGPVVFEVDHFDRHSRSAWSVILHGRAKEITAYDHPSVQHRLDALTFEVWTPTSKPHLIRISPTTVTGRRIGEMPGQ